MSGEGWAPCEESTAWAQCNSQHSELSCWSAVWVAVVLPHTHGMPATAAFRRPCQLPTLASLPHTGFGGPKRLRKQNDASSAADVDNYRPSRFDDGVARKVAKKFGGEQWVAAVWNSVLPSGFER